MDAAGPELAEPHAMQSSLLSPLSPISLTATPPDAAAKGVVDPAELVTRVRMALGDYQAQPGDADTWTQLTEALGAASAMVARLPRKETQSAIVEDVRQLVRDVTASGAHDRPVAADDLARATSMARKGWQGMLGAMLLTPAWQWASAPLLLDAPSWLLGDYIAWLFAAPQGFCALGDAEKYAAHTLQRLEELVRWVNRSPGIQVETDVLTAYATKSSGIPLYFAEGSLRRHAELRGKLLSRAFVQPGDTFAPEAMPREGRRLRVGIVRPQFGPETETYGTLPTFEELDPERFEVILFANRSAESVVEQHCRKHSSDLFVLPEDIDGQLAMLRSAALDVVSFGTNITAVFNEITRIALHRVAPLQVVNVSSCITSGLPHADLYVSGALTDTTEAPSYYSERLGLMPGSAHAFSYYADREEPQMPCTRADFGIPDDALLFVSGSNYYKVIPEMQHAWAKLLAAVPESRLLLHPFSPNWSSDYPIARFRAEFERVLANHGVEASRLAISTLCFPSRTDVKGLLSLGNIYLDTFPFAGANSLVDPLELGLPVVTWEGGTLRSRMGAALLRQLELPEFIATSEADYLVIAEKLAKDAGYRAASAAAVAARMERTPLFLDMLAAGEAFGDVIEKAYDELVAVGPEKFRANRTPVMAATAPTTDSGEILTDEVAHAREVLRRSPADADARHVIGRSLLEAGRAGRAATYLLGALQGEEAKADLWLDVARALQADGKLNEALQALEAGLRLDQSKLEGWVLFADIAHTLGSADIAREAAGVARQLAPDDDRVLAYL